MKPESKDRWIRILCNFSRLHRVRPGSYSPSGVTLSGEKPYKAVGSVEVWKGKQGRNNVCVKAFRLLGPGTDGTKQVCDGSHRGVGWAQLDFYQEFYHEIVRWKYISHPNVLPFLGVLEESPGLPRFCIISPWLENGNILEYLSKSPNVNRFELVSRHRSWQ